MRERERKWNTRTLSRGRICHGLGRSCQELLGLTNEVDYIPIDELELEEITEKGGGHMMLQAINRIVHMRRFRIGARRSLAAALCLALVLPMTASFAANTQLSPIQVKKATADEFPHIEVEGNFVRDEFGFLTGYYELGLRVRTPEKGTFTGLSVALQYDASILTPVDWSEIGADVTIENKEYYEVQLPTQKLASISTATAHSGIPAAQGGTTGGTGGGTTTTAAGKQALMSFAVNSYDPVAFPGDTSDPDVTPDATTLAVVRFRVNKTVMDNVSITKTSTGGYEVKCGNYVVTDIASLLDAFQKTAALTGVGTGKELVTFTPDADIKTAGDESYNADAQMALDYRGGFETVGGKAYINEYYHIPEYKSDNAGTYDANVKETIEGKDYTFDRKPKTVNNLVLAVDPTVTDTATAWGTGKFSYITNLMVNAQPNYVVLGSDGKPSNNYITFPVVSKRSFMAQGDQLGNLTTIVYVDWDNTLLGTQVVPKNVDIRQLVSDHVAENFIYHDDIDTAYGGNDLNNPLEGNPTDPKALVSSLKRIDNYRGKYTANGPATESTTDSTVVTDGGDYPLTNKLDYVFLKRPMTHTNAFDEVTNPKPDPDDEDAGGNKKYPGGVTDPQYITDLAAYQAAYDAWYWDKTEWSQQVDDAGDLVWDAERPYAYGWAECTIDNYEDVWTTLGRGELGSAAARTEIGANGATKGYNGANAGGYQAIPSTSIASVTYDGDADFAFADLSKGFNRSMVFLKAVYEPGEDLLSEGYAYSLIKKPYYNKFNNKPADDGGAYMISVEFERSALNDDGNLVGTARIREPVIRQDTTTDLRWEESTTPLVNHNLTNPTWKETYNSKNKTTYTKLDVPNSEIIALEMSFSARQNKIDYFLRENYKKNFVSAGERTNTNSARSFEEFVVDNYNYYVNDTAKVPSDYYAPTAYENREGTYGFVLFGTLNYLMEQATLYANNERAYDDFFNDVYYSHFDANLKDKSGNAITDIDSTMTILKNAADEAATHKGAADEADYWNKDRQCAELTYHQLQWYIINNTLLDRTTADNASHKIKWCHLHAACAALQSGKPEDWKTLIAAASEKSTAKLEMLTVDSTKDEIESKFHLRKDANGTGGWDKSTFAAQLIDAVDKLKKACITDTSITWDQVQYVLDKGVADVSATDMNKYGAEHYWWYDGEDLDSNLDTTHGETAFGRLLQAADVALTTSTSTAKLPDDMTSVVGRTAKLNLLKNEFPADENDPGQKWVTITENLTMGQKGATGEDAGKVKPFTDFDDFTGKLTTAVAALGTNVTWNEIQYYILNGVPGGATNTEYSKYWWHNGGINIADLATLLKAAKKGGNTWSGVSFTTFDNLNLDLAADLKGTAIDNSNFAAVKTVIAAYANETGADLTNNAWDAVQYYIIHSAVNANRTTAEKSYYWWADGGASRPKTAATFTPTSTETDAAKKNKALADDLAKKLSEAYFKSEFNGYTDTDVGWDGVLTSADLQAGRLAMAMGSDAKAYPADFTLFNIPTDLTALKTAVGTAFAAVNGGAGNLTPDDLSAVPKPYTALTWDALQKALIPSASELWWKEKDSLGKSNVELFEDVQKTLLAFANDPGDSAKLQALKDAFTWDAVQKMDLDASTVNGVPIDESLVNYVNGMWPTIVANTIATPIDITSVKITWNQMASLFDNIYNGFGNYIEDATTSDTFGYVTPTWAQAIPTSFSLRAPMRITPNQLRAQQTQDATDYQTALTEALGEDPALAAAMAENADYMDSLKALAAALGFELTPKTGDKTYDTTQDVTVHETTNNTATENQTVTNEADKNEVNQDETTGDKTVDDKTYKKTEDVTIHEIDDKNTQENQQEQQEQQTAGTSGTEKKETAKNTTTTVDNTAALNGETGEKQQPETVARTVTTNTDNRTPETGQGDVSILDTSQAGVDPPPDKSDGELPLITGIAIIEGLEKTTEGVNVA